MDKQRNYSVSPLIGQPSQYPAASADFANPLRLPPSVFSSANTSIVYTIYTPLFIAASKENSLIRGNRKVCRHRVVSFRVERVRSIPVVRPFISSILSPFPFFSFLHYDSNPMIRYPRYANFTNFSYHFTPVTDRRTLATKHQILFYSVMDFLHFCFFPPPIPRFVDSTAIVPFTPAKADYGEAKFTVGRNVEVFVRHFAPRRPRLGVIQMQIH